jgi:hypothetical protein
LKATFVRSHLTIRIIPKELSVHSLTGAVAKKKVLSPRSHGWMRGIVFLSALLSLLSAAPAQSSAPVDQPVDDQAVAQPSTTTQPATQPSSQPASCPASQPVPSAAFTDRLASRDWLDNLKLVAPLKQQGPPLPFHTIEGYGGGAITPMAYLVNPGPKGTIFGLPAAAFSNIIAGRKNLQAFTFTETVLGRFEFGYGLDRFGIGSLDENIQKATGVDIDRESVWMHNFNIRALLLEENAFKLPLPEITAGVHFKVNDGIADVNHRLGGALTNIGYARPYGTDFTLTATKTFLDKTLTLNRPLIASVGMRNSDASNLGFLGFSDNRVTTVEANVAYLPTDWLLVAYEFRQRGNVYDSIPGLIKPEDNWNAIDVSWIINKNMTLVAGWAALGNLADTTENGAWFIQFKYEF